MSGLETFDASGVLSGVDEVGIARDGVKAVQGEETRQENIRFGDTRLHGSNAGPTEIDRHRRARA